MKRVHCLESGVLYGYVEGFGLWVSDAGGSFVTPLRDVCNWNLTEAWINRFHRRYRDQTDDPHQRCDNIGAETYWTGHYVARGKACTRLWIEFYGRMLTEVCHDIFPQ